MNEHIVRQIIRVLTHDETRFWHSRFNRYFCESHQARIVEWCEDSARRAGCAAWLVFDAYENLVAQGQVAPAQ